MKLQFECGTRGQYFLEPLLLLYFDLVFAHRQRTDWSAYTYSIRVFGLYMLNSFFARWPRTINVANYGHLLLQPRLLQ